MTATAQHLPSGPEFVESNIGLIIHFVRRHRFAKNHPELADDVAQETYLQILGRYATYDGRSKSLFMRWMLSHAVRAVVGSPSRRRPWRHQLGDAVTVDLADLREDSGESTERDAQLVRLEAAVERLPAREREVIKLRYAEGNNYAEIGEAFHFSRQRAKQLEQRACGRLAGLVARATYRSTSAETRHEA